MFGGRSIIFLWRAVHGLMKFPKGRYLPALLAGISPNTRIGMVRVRAKRRLLMHALLNYLAGFLRLGRVPSRFFRHGLILPHATGKTKKRGVPVPGQKKMHAL